MIAADCSYHVILLPTGLNRRCTGVSNARRRIDCQHNMHIFVLYLRNIGLLNAVIQLSAYNLHVGNY